MSNQVQRNTNGKKILLLFIITNAVYILMLTVTIPAVVSYSGGKKLPDMMPTGYDLPYLQALFTALGMEGRNVYLFRQIPLDMFYPFLFALTYVLLFMWLLEKLGWQQSWLRYCALLPPLAGFFDYMENAGIIYMLHSYPDISTAIAVASSVCTQLKSVFTTLYFILLLIVLGWFTFHKITTLRK